MQNVKSQVYDWVCIDLTKNKLLHVQCIYNNILAMIITALILRVSGMELGLENRRRESESQINLPRGDIPQQHIPVRRRGEELVSAPVPAERRDWMDVSAAEPSDPSSEEVPDGDATIIAADRQQCTPSVECTGEGLAARVQYAIIVLQNRGRRYIECNAFYIKLTSG